MSSSSGLTQPAWIRVGKHPVAIEEQRGDNQPWMLEFRLLGPVEAIADSASLDLGGPKQRAVLALLLLHANEVLARERLIDDLWGDDPPATARETLKAYVGRLRKAISVEDASARLRSCGGGYLFVISEEPVPGAFQVTVRTASE